MTTKYICDSCCILVQKKDIGGAKQWYIYRLVTSIMSKLISWF